MNEKFTKRRTWVLDFQNGHQRLKAVSREQEGRTFKMCAKSTGMGRELVQQLVGRWMETEVLSSTGMEYHGGRYCKKEI